MNNSFEKYFRSNRDTFDDLEPSENTWKHIDQQLDSNQAIRGHRFDHWWKVAAVLFLCTTGWLLLDRLNMEDNQHILAENPEYIEFQEAQQYYAELIGNKRQEIMLRNNEKPDLGKEFLMDIDRLDSLYLVLKNELKKNQGSEKIRNAMILNLQIRLNLLNQQLNILEELKTTESDENITI